MGFFYAKILNLISMIEENDIPASLDFIRTRVAEDLKANKNGGKVHTRFPPEPNGYLHIGHAKALCLDFEIASENNGLCNLRFDDTNPDKETVEFEENIMRDIRWLGFDWGDRLYYASDYFEKFYECAVQLIKEGKAYVEDLSADQIREYRGTLTEPGRNSPYRDRSVAENLDLFTRMRAGEFEEGQRILRAKIDMTSGNLNMRDPALYRIKKVSHYRAGDKWCIYPMYDFAHPISDALESVTHSMCSLEFEDHRPLYDWVLDQFVLPSRPVQIEFGRLNIGYTVTSKRKLAMLVSEGHVRGWDDPRMPTLSACRRRGYTPESIRNFCRTAGVGKRRNDMVVEMAMLEHTVREDLNRHAARVMGVLNPLRVVIENYPEGQTEELDAVNNPADPESGTRKVPFSRVLYIEQDDFREDPPKKFFRLSPGREVRLRYAYFITCTNVVKDAAGNSHRTAVLVRSCNSRRRFSGRAFSESHNALGFCGARRSGRDSPLRPAVYRRAAERSRRCGIQGGHQSEFAGDTFRTPTWSRAWPRQNPATVFNLNGRDISVSIRILRKGSWCSTGRSRFAMPGRKSNRG